MLSRVYSINKCPGLDSNQHAVASTTTSKWLVYQFQHLGDLRETSNCNHQSPRMGCKNRGFQLLKNSKGKKNLNRQNNPESCSLSWFRLLYKNGSVMILLYDPF
jgi:hypothetical protein